MRKNKTKAKIKAGESAIGTFINFHSEAVVEVCGLIGFDFVVIDAEHGPLNEQSCENLVRAADIVDVTPIVRVPRNAPEYILRFLDIGALGVQVPMVNNKEDALRAVSSVKYHPLGMRGLAGARASDYGLTNPLSHYVSEANQETMIILQIETAEGVENLSEILTVEEIDAIFLGSTDLSQSYGHPGHPDHPIVQEAIDRVIEECLSSGKVVGIYEDDAERVREYMDRGVQLFETWSLGFMIRASKEFLHKTRG